MMSFANLPIIPRGRTYQKRPCMMLSHVAGAEQRSRRGEHLMHDFKCRKYRVYYQIALLTTEDAVAFKSWLYSIHYNANTTSTQVGLAITLQRSNQTQWSNRKHPRKRSKVPSEQYRSRQSPNSPTQSQTPVDIQPGIKPGGYPKTMIGSPRNP